MSTLLMQEIDESILAARARRRHLVARCREVGEQRLADEGALLVEASMGAWRIWEVDALSVLEWTPRGAA